MGGLGIHKLKDINLALLAKWGWRFKTEKDNLWVGVINALHSGRNGWEFLPLKKTLGGVWKNIVLTLNLPLLDGFSISNLFKGVVGRGDNILFWLDPWLFEVQLKSKFPALFQLEVVKSCSVRDRLEGEGSWLWKHDPESPSERLEWDALFSALALVDLNSVADKWVCLEMARIPSRSRRLRKPSS
ncbi:uncharacterized protein LOC110883074 [Helianthus annuus]|uniref:uncharacterized protein LOC110883074 n=1 Tax=Helianthus annuus TaxID=4232 RepID=UPI000B9053B0|nr:uncharacterized protein LOC110883074 [Helianthus annuus]